jgi:hypothetical protein
MEGTVTEKLLRRALVVNLPWEKREKPAVTYALKSIGCDEVVQIPNSPEGWEKLKKGFCAEHDFTIVLFHASGTTVDNMVERFLKQEASTPTAFTELSSSHDNGEDCLECPEH